MEVHNNDGGAELKTALDNYEVLRQEAARSLLAPVVEKSVRTKNTQVTAKLVKDANKSFNAVKDFIEAGSQISGDIKYLGKKHYNMENAYGIAHSWDMRTGKLDLKAELAAAMSNQMGIKEENAALLERHGYAKLQNSEGKIESSNIPVSTSQGVSIEKLAVSDRSIEFGTIELPKPLLTRYQNKISEQQANAPSVPTRP